MKSWKTTVSGICMIVTALIGAATALINGTAINYEVTIAAIIAGVGLILAKDSNVTNASPTTQQAASTAVVK